jgi:hypothetical protein
MAKFALSLSLLALAFPATSVATLPIHPGHPILPVSAKEAARERAMVKSFYLRSAREAIRLSRPH